MSHPAGRARNEVAVWSGHLVAEMLEEVMKLASIQVGKPQLIGVAGAAEPMEREWETGFYKKEIAGGVYAGFLGLDGDGVADLRVHGGIDKAINVYAAEHYPYWEEELGFALAEAAFGENFTVTGALEEEIFIGDVYRIGGATVQVSQPRQPCWKLARRWRVKDLAARVEATGKTGWYFRVLEEGRIEGPEDFELLERPFPEWSVARANKVMKRRRAEPERAAALAACPALAEAWRRQLAG